jgi:pimeloyl-ACP methyl ester carboxylesterase
MTSMSAVETTKPVRGRWKRWIRRLLLAGTVIFCGAAMTGATWEFVCERRDARRFPQEGRLVDVGGFRLNIHCTGTGGPAVILDSGMGIPAMGWDLVQPDVQKFTQVCSYDRAGYGWSDPGPLPRTSRQIAHELHTLLQNAGIPAPYILVGHSFGGFNVRVYCGLYPNEVAGMVLVDSPQEDANALVSAKTAAAEERKMKLLARVYPVLLRLGVARWYLTRDADPTPDRLYAGLYCLILKPRHIPAMLDEYMYFDRESAEQVRKSGNLGDRPLIVLTAGDVGPPDPDMSKKDWDAAIAEHAERQRKLARLSTRGQQIVVEKSGHDIQLERPRVVTKAIRSVFDSVIETRR